MLEYFELSYSKMAELKNYELMIKVAIDLIETFKFKVNEIEGIEEAF